MTREEIERHLNAGRARSVRVDVSNTPEYPGFVRTITIYVGNVVTVEFNSHGYDEGGAVFKATFGSLDEAIGAVEQYLGRPLADWVNFSRLQRFYPSTPMGDRYLASLPPVASRHRYGDHVCSGFRRTGLAAHVCIGPRLDI